MSDHHDVPYTPRNEYLCDTSTAETVMHYGGCKCHEQWWGNRYSELEKQRDALIKDLARSEEGREKLKEALAFYASRPTRGGAVGMRYEFGCGCCAGTMVAGKDGEPELDYDSSVCGQTAREAFAEDSK